jgi:hypothetical protein
MADEEDSKLFFKEMHKFHVENKLPKRSPDHCPLLEAESLVRDIKIQVCEFLQPYLGISYDAISWSLPAYKSYYDLIMTMFAPAVAEYQKTNPLPVR